MVADKDIGRHLRTMHSCVAMSRAQARARRSMRVRELWVGTCRFSVHYPTHIHHGCSRIQVSNVCLGTPHCTFHAAMARRLSFE